jgi:hypothetical protein
MRPETKLMIVGGMLAAAGGAMLAVSAFDGAGWLILSAGGVAAGMGAWFVRRGGNTPHPPAVAVALPAAVPTRVGCPKCGEPKTRPMTPVETTSFYGFDRFVLTRPRKCLECGHGFEVLPSLAGCYTMVGVAAAGVCLGLVLMAVGLFGSYLMAAKCGTVGQLKAAAGAVGLLTAGPWWVVRSCRVSARYWSLRAR